MIKSHALCQPILGHSNVAMTLSRYVHPTLEMKRCNMAKMR